MTHLPPEGQVKSSEYKPGTAPADENRDHFEEVDTAAELDVLNRELEEPHDFYNPIPFWWVVGLLVMLGWGGWYLAKYADHWSSTRLDVPPAWYEEQGGGGGVPGAGNDGPQEVTLVDLGRREYSNCATCHKADGSGEAGVYPPLIASEWVKGEPEVLAAIILKGVQGEMTVKGNVYNGNMDPWEQLGARKIAGIMSYIRTDAGFGNNSTEVSVEFVEKVIEHHAGRSTQWTEAELLKVKEEAPARRAAWEAELGGGAAPEETAPEEGGEEGKTEEAPAE